MDNVQSTSWSSTQCCFFLVYSSHCWKYYWQEVIERMEWHWWVSMSCWHLHWWVLCSSSYDSEAIFLNPNVPSCGGPRITYPPNLHYRWQSYIWHSLWTFWQETPWPSFLNQLLSFSAILFFYLVLKIAIFQSLRMFGCDYFKVEINWQS